MSKELQSKEYVVQDRQVGCNETKMTRIVQNQSSSSWSTINTSKATVNDARYKVSRIVKLVEIVEIKVDCHFYFYYALVGLYSANFFC